jgi:hypothetical protein
MRLTVEQLNRNAFSGNGQKQKPLMHQALARGRGWI